MAVTIRAVRTARDLKEFVRFPFRVYGEHPCWVPPLLVDEVETFTPARNPAYDDAESRQFLAYRDGEPVGRVAAILSRAANRKYGTANLRFGWFECLDDAEAALALFGEVEKWARELGMTTLSGPHGFCDLDPNGLLVEGFGELGTLTGNYNHPYYPGLVEAAGFVKEIDYVEFTCRPPAGGLPEKLERLLERVRRQSSFRLVPFRTNKEVAARAREIFDLLNETFEEVYGTIPLSDRQMDFYVKKYIPYVDPTLIKAVVNPEDEMVGFLLTMPSLSRPLQRARGRLFPLGWFWILRGLKERETLDFLLAGVRKDCRGVGVDLLMIADILRTATEQGFARSESNQELETNTRVQAFWQYFDPVQHKRRRVYRKSVG